MDFARKILGKYGWKDGDGLGKNSNGIAKPLRATLKFDNAGFGANQADSDFNNHWWERVFNDAANNVEVKQEGGSVKMDLKNEDDAVEISTKGYSLKKLKKAKATREISTVAGNAYGNFLQVATLTNLGGEVENPNHIEASDIEVTKVKVLTDEELFKACGGRTAHKGARHGLKLSGKLLRLEQQEKELLAKMMAKTSSGTESNENTSNTKEKQLKKNNEEGKQSDTEDVPKKDSESKKKKRKHLSEENAEYQLEECQNAVVKKKKSKRNSESKSSPADELDQKYNDEAETPASKNGLENVCCSQETLAKKKKKKKQNADVYDTLAQEKYKALKSKNEGDNIEEAVAIVHKKKKSKKKTKSKQE